jgi:hypothetical protein
MLGLVLIYSIGKYYYNLAALHEKNKWLFAIIGVASYYAGTFISGIALGIVLLGFETSVDELNRVVLALIALPFGIGTTLLVYHLLKKNWQKNKKADLEMMEQIGTEMAQ